MSQQSRNIWHVLALSVLLAGSPASAAAEEEEDPFDGAPAKAVGVVAESNFERWVFQERAQIQGNRVVLQEEK